MKGEINLLVSLHLVPSLIKGKGPRGGKPEEGTPFSAYKVTHNINYTVTHTAEKHSG